jgi:hypothetical protein
LLIEAGYLSEPPTREEVDDWVADETRRSARSVLARCKKVSVPW